MTHSHRDGSTERLGAWAAKRAAGTSAYEHRGVARLVEALHAMRCTPEASPSSTNARLHHERALDSACSFAGRLVRRDRTGATWRSGWAVGAHFAAISAAYCRIDRRALNTTLTKGGSSGTSMYRADSCSSIRVAGRDRRLPAARRRRRAGESVAARAPRCRGRPGGACDARPRRPRRAGVPLPTGGTPGCRRPQSTRGGVGCG